MPSQFCDYWGDKAIEYKGDYPMACDYCDEPIEKGDRFFYLIAVNKEPSKKIFVPGREMFINVSKRGHVSHLKPAPEQEWVYDPAKQLPQPWEEDPSIPPPPGWEEWKRRNRGVNYG